MKPNCKECHKYQERAAIIEHHGCCEDRREAERLARMDTCIGCPGDRGVGLFDRENDK
jgi:hypothetical protein